MDNTTVITRLQQAPEGSVLETREFRGELQVRIRPESLIPLVQFLRGDAELSYNFLENVNGVDYLGREPRFEVVYHLLSHTNRHRICLKAGLPESNPHIATITSEWATATYMEREVYDMFGVVFDGHPSLDRILMPEDWNGHPQRKDVPLGYEEVAFTINEQQIYERKPFAKE
ncbi:NADH-quinone oxidoreductase subunit C [Chloroflexia bacterium SDU3-3]|nr:NADH-quinone oxidoreductase subunit C [Chloroflexia bacterium SDU3-3]